MKKLYTSLFLALAVTAALQAQQPPTPGFGGGGGMVFQEEEQPGEAQLQALNAIISANIQALKAKNIIPQNSPNELDTIRLAWPVRQAAGFNDPGYYGISNYVDQDLSANTLEYNCGKRTYNGHRGTDIYTTPFPWMKQDQNAVEVIAAADGVIVGKFDGNADTSCANCNPNLPTCQWNAVFVRNNQDGSVCWYGHLKKNSATAKNIGDAVVKGEYIGVVGSSGNSTGPHLHFEVWLNENYNFLYDPWAGACNSDKNSSLWENQEPYYKPGVDLVTSAWGVPSFSQCYQDGKGENPRLKNEFTYEETVYFPVYLRDNLPNKLFYLQVIKPDNTVMWDWTNNSFNAFYSSAWGYWFWPGTNFNIPGTWKFRFTYEGSTVEHPFTMMSVLPLTLVSFKGQQLAKSNLLVWKTTEETGVDKFVVERSADGAAYEFVGALAAKGNNLAGATNEYQYEDMLPVKGMNYYRLKMVDKDGRYTYSNIVQLHASTEPVNLLILSNPASNELRFITAADHLNAQVAVVNQLGVRVSNTKITVRRNQQVAIDISRLPRGKYYLLVQDGKDKLSKPFIKL